MHRPPQAKARIAVVVTGAIAVLVWLVVLPPAEGATSAIVETVLALGLACAGLVAYSYTVRCPHCAARLGLRLYDRFAPAKYCRDCGRGFPKRRF